MKDTEVAKKLGACLGRFRDHHKALLFGRAPFQLLHHLPSVEKKRRAVSPSSQASSRQRSEEPALLRPEVKAAIPSSEVQQAPPPKKPRTEPWRPSLQIDSPWPSWEEAMQELYPPQSDASQSIRPLTVFGSTSASSSSRPLTMFTTPATSSSAAGSSEPHAAPSRQEQPTTVYGDQTVEEDPTPSPRDPPTTVYGSHAPDKETQPASRV